MPTSRYAFVAPNLRIALREDIVANRGHMKGMILVVLFRIASHARQPSDQSPRLRALPAGFVYKLVSEWILGFEMPWGTQVGRRLRIWHAYGTVISPNAVLGDDVLLRHGVTIGNDGRHTEIAPVIGNGVEIGAGAVIVGHVHVGDGAQVGANAVVVSSVPARSVAVGVPARIIQANK